ncbi:MAG: hypothetical protein LBC99_02640 [Spirochaetota bacterium]|jgi:hypothetical protein|nr:hypothetical protein [Spirochaetota bacterium]
MRTTLRIALSVLLLCCACGQKMQIEKEPNDTPQTATQVTAEAAVRGELSGAADRDYLCVAVPSGKLLSFILEHARDADIAVEVYRAGILIKLVDGLAAREAQEGQPAREYASFISSQGEDIILLIRAVSAEGKFPAAWQLFMELTLADARVEREPNDTPSEATPIYAGKTIEGRYSPVSNPISVFGDGAERDFYQYVNDSTNRVMLELEVSGVPDVDAVIEIYNEEGRISRTIDAEGVHYGEASGQLGLEPSMTCTFALRAKTRQGNPYVSYRLRARVTEADLRTEFEPNDNAETANLLTAGEATRGRIFPEGDVDYYKLLLPAAGRYTISARLAPDGDADLALELMDKEGRVLLTADNEPARRAEYIANYGCIARGNNMELYFVVRAKPGARDTGYSIMANYHPAGAFAEFEPNDTPAAANPLTPGVEMRGYFFPAGDQDWFYFDLERESILDMRLITPAGVKAGMRLQNADGQAAAATPSFAAGEVRLRTHSLPEGRWFLLLAAEDDANPRDPWLLTVAHITEDAE